MPQYTMIYYNVFSYSIIYYWEPWVRLGERPEIEEAVTELERRAKGWLESDEAWSC